MNRDDIIRMAHEADCLDEQHYGSVWANKLEQFANLVAAAEREACAKLCEEDGLLWGKKYAIAIRARSVNNE
jgi:hypothetical protein